MNLVHDQHDSGQMVGARKTDGGWSMTGARGDVTLLAVTLLAVTLLRRKENVPRDAVGSVVVFVCSIEEQPLVFGF